MSNSLETRSDITTDPFSGANEGEGLSSYFTEDYNNRLPQLEVLRDVQPIALPQILAEISKEHQNPRKRWSLSGAIRGLKDVATRIIDTVRTNPKRSLAGALGITAITLVAACLPPGSKDATPIPAPTVPSSPTAEPMPTAIRIIPEPTPISIGYSALESLKTTNPEVYKTGIQLMDINDKEQRKEQILPQERPTAENITQFNIVVTERTITEAMNAGDYKRVEELRIALDDSKRTLLRIQSTQRSGTTQNLPHSSSTTTAAPTPFSTATVGVSPTAERPAPPKATATPNSPQPVPTKSLEGLNAKPNNPGITETKPEVTNLKYQRMPDGSTAFKTEKGEFKNVPNVPGLKQEVRTINGEQKLVYIAQPDNAYRLKEGEVAGVLYEQVYDVKDSKENAEQTGGIKFKTQIINHWLKQNGSPKSKAVFPIPLNLTDGKLLIQEAIAPNGDDYFFMGAPTGSEVVVPYGDQNNQASIDIIPQSGGFTVISVGKPTLLDKFDLDLYFNKKLEPSTRTLTVGSPIFSVTAERMPMNSGAKSMIPPMMAETNFMLMAQQSFVDKNTGGLPKLGVKKGNLLRVPGSQFYALFLKD